MKAVNLLPDHSGQVKRSRGRTRSASPKRPVPVGALAVLGGLAVVVVAVVLMSLAGNRVRESESRLAAVKAQEQSVAGQIARLQTYGTFRQLAADRISTVRQLAGSRFGWEQALRDLSRAIPADVTIANITGSVTAGARAGAGSSANPLRAALAVPAIELQGCTRDHSSVARLMARLRSVRGVSRVSLASSAKEAAVAGAGTVGSGTAAPGGCGRGSKPKFEAVMFFRAVAGSASADASPPAGAPATGTAVAGSTATATPTSTPTPVPVAGAASGTVAPGGQAPVNQEGTK